MTFAIQVHDWLIRGVRGRINQSRARIVKDIINSENCYIIYLLRIIDIQKKIYFHYILSWIFEWIGALILINYNQTIWIYSICIMLKNKSFFRWIDVFNSYISIFE